MLIKSLETQRRSLNDSSMYREVGWSRFCGSERFMAADIWISHATTTLKRGRPFLPPKGHDSGPDKNQNSSQLGSILSKVLYRCAIGRKRPFREEKQTPFPPPCFRGRFVPGAVGFYGAGRLCLKLLQTTARPGVWKIVVV